ncbi:hypothetical protein AWC02_05810 [Mycolicibacter engbaekii]|uniref:Uncharacterized protein n=1 Tax=Mycolicibacter engbaekii TaxID=188915 RepID=A0A1X1TZH4_9MYCO|nr:hypothetical protein AWC02_05810 [Mycolicibacter engbaekii]
MLGDACTLAFLLQGFIDTACLCRTFLKELYASVSSPPQFLGAALCGVEALPVRIGLLGQRFEFVCQPAQMRAGLYIRGDHRDVGAEI